MVFKLSLLLKTLKNTLYYLAKRWHIIAETLILSAIFTYFPMSLLRDILSTDSFYFATILGAIMDTNRR